VLVVGLPTLVNAQTATPPPLLTAPPESTEAPQEPAPPQPQGELISREWKSERPNLRVPRILAGALLGTAAATGGVVGGFLLGLQLAKNCDPFDDVCGSGELFAIVAPAALGGAALSSLTVYGMGSLLHGEGALSTTLLGAFAGAGIGVALCWVSSAALLLFPPLIAAGAVIAYELSDAAWEEARLGGSQAWVTPVVVAMPGGGVLGGLMGRF
jgi:hypothetical protein